MRFALSTAGLATVSFSGMAMAGTINVTDQIDRWYGEHYWQMTDASSNIVASASGITYTGSFDYFSSASNPSGDIWGSVFLGMTLANGTYNVQMQDSYGDGWAWGSFVGGLYVTGDVSAAAGASMPGSAASFSFTVVPAPGAMALLGLAGLAARRRRRD